MVKKFTLLDKVFNEYKKSVNMNFSELKNWSKTNLSRQTMLSKRPIQKNLELLKTKKSKWGKNEIKWAIIIIKTLRRLKKQKGSKKKVYNLSTKDIMLKNWGFNVNKRVKK